MIAASPKPGVKSARPSESKKPKDPARV
jgi:hypothetical protein